jgi:DNA-binding transcriptional LysR family regulator
MELRQLRHLLALADTASFSRAATRLHLTQSALSRSIQTLEASMGGQLVDRIGKRNELTPLGREVVAQGRQVVQAADELKASLDPQRRGRVVSLRVGLGSGPGALLMTPLLVHLAQHEPGARAEVQGGATELQLLQLRQRELDALVVDVRRVVPAPDLRIEQVADLRAGFVCRAGHPLAQRPAVALQAVLAYPVASTPLSDEVARQLVDQYGDPANPAQMTTLCCEDVASLIATVRQTDAVFLGILAAARDALLTGELVALAIEPALAARARFALVTLAGRTESAGIGFLRRFIAEHLKD